MLPRAAAHVFVTDLESPLLDERDVHHLSRVLRLRPGEAVTASDGAGAWLAARWTGTGVEADGVVRRDPPAELPVGIGFGLTKGERPEWVVQKLTEIGVDVIVPVAAARSVVRWSGDKAAAARHRLQLVAREAAMQSRRVWLPEVTDVLSFADAVARLGPAAALAQLGGGPLDLGRPAVLVGPEGGWTPEELACGLPTVDLGPTVLRSETAAIAAAVRLCALRAAK